MAAVEADQAGCRIDDEGCAADDEHVGVADIVQGLLDDVIVQSFFTVTTSGLRRPPQASHFGTPSLWSMYSASKNLWQRWQKLRCTLPCSSRTFLLPAF